MRKISEVSQLFTNTWYNNNYEMVNVVKNISGLIHRGKKKRIHQALKTLQTKKETDVKHDQLKGTAAEAGLNLGHMIPFQKLKQWSDGVGKVLNNVLILEIVQVWFVVKEK